MAVRSSKHGYAPTAAAGWPMRTLTSRGTMPTPDDDNPFTAEPRDLSREDELVKGDTFRTWLWRTAVDPASPYNRLREVIGKSGKPFTEDYEQGKFAAHLERLCPDEPKLIEDLIAAAAEWRVESLANTKARSALGLRETKEARAALMPTTVCGFVSVSGARCRHMAVPGSIRCPEHGGALLSPEVRRAMLISSYCAIVAHTQLAVDALVDVAKTGRNELARVQAAKELLDRAGLSPEISIRVEIEDSETRSEVLDRLRTRLDGMQRGLLARVLDTTATDIDPTEDFPIGNGHPDNGHSSN